jgi:hypothetical protein
MLPIAVMSGRRIEAAWSFMLNRRRTGELHCSRRTAPATGRSPP